MNVAKKINQVTSEKFETMQKAALYIRVSTDEQIEYSPAAQQKALLDYASKHNMIVDSDHIYIDEGYSGRNANKRPAFMRMIGTAKQKPTPFDTILVHKFDRFARNREDSVVYKSLLRSQCGIKVISITEHLEDDKFSVIMESMLEAMAEYYSINLSEEVRKGMTEKASRGELQAPPCYGYRVNNNILIPYQPEADIVKLIYSKYLEGEHSLFRLAKTINALGAKTKKGKNFENRTIEYILRNPTYTGFLPWTPDQRKNRNFNLDSTLLSKGKHQPLISQEDFDQVQKLLNENKAKHRYKQRPPTEYRHWLSGIIRCDNCGSTLVYTGSSAHPSFQCRGYTGGKCHISHSIIQHKLEQSVLDGLKDAFSGTLENYHTVKKPNQNTTERQMIEKQLSTIASKLTRAKDAYLEGIDTVEEYKHNKQTILQEEETLRQKLDSLKAPTTDINVLHRQLKTLYDILTSNVNNADKSNILHEAIEKIVYCRAAESLDFYFYV